MVERAQTSVNLGSARKVKKRACERWKPLSAMRGLGQRIEQICKLRLPQKIINVKKETSIMTVRELHEITVRLMNQGLAKAEIRDAENLTHVIDSLKYNSALDEVIVEFECAELVYQPSEAVAV